MWVNVMGVMLDVLTLDQKGERAEICSEEAPGLSGSNYPDVPLLPPTAPEQE